MNITPISCQASINSKTKCNMTFQGKVNLNSIRNIGVSFIETRQTGGKGLNEILKRTIAFLAGVIGISSVLKKDKHTDTEVSESNSSKIADEFTNIGVTESNSSKIADEFTKIGVTEFSNLQEKIYEVCNKVKETYEKEYSDANAVAKEKYYATIIKLPSTDSAKAAYDKKVSDANSKLNDSLANAHDEYDKKVIEIEKEYDEKLKKINKDYDDKHKKLKDEYESRSHEYGMQASDDYYSKTMKLFFKREDKKSIIDKEYFDNERLCKKTYNELCARKHEECSKAIKAAKKDYDAIINLHSIAIRERQDQEYLKDLNFSFADEISERLINLSQKEIRDIVAGLITSDNLENVDLESVKQQIAQVSEKYLNLANEIFKNYKIEKLTTVREPKYIPGHMDDLSVLNDTEVWVKGYSVPGEYKYSITGIDDEFVYEGYYIAGVACDKVFKKVKV